MTKNCDRLGRESWLCIECGMVKPEITVVDVTLVDEPVDCPLNFIKGNALGVMHRDFLSLLNAESASRNLFLGQIFRVDGGTYDAWVSFHGHQRIIVRGTKHITYRMCPACGQIAYFALGPKYLCPQPQDDVEIFDNECGQLVVTRAVYERIRVTEWEKLLVKKLPVFEKPKDSLPVDLFAVE